jgi:hypothetical protein
MVLLQQRFLRTTTKLCLLFALLLCVSPAFSQNYLEVPVRLDIDNGNMDGVLVKVKKNGKDAFTQSGSSKMRLKLDYNKKYTLIFTKDGYITKTIEFDTQAPADRIKDGFEPYTIGVKLFAQSDDKHQVIYNQAVGLVKFDSVLDEFSYDTDYSKSILSNMNDMAQKEDSAAKEKSTPEKTKDKPGKKKKEDPETASSEDPVAENGKAPGKVKPNGNDETPSSKGRSGNENPPSGKGRTGNEVPPGKTGNGGNDNSNLVAMADGGDPSSGLIGASDMDVPSAGNLSAGNEKPSVNFSPSGGAEKTGGALMSAGGKENFGAAEVYESQSITREDIVEDKCIITIVRVTKRNTTTEYRRVKYRWGGPFYFLDNKLSISETVFAFYTGVKD